MIWSITCVFTCIKVVCLWSPKIQVNSRYEQIGFGMSTNGSKCPSPSWPCLHWTHSCRVWIGAGLPVTLPSGAGAVFKSGCWFKSLEATFLKHNQHHYHFIFPVKISKNINLGGALFGAPFCSQFEKSYGLFQFPQKVSSSLSWSCADPSQTLKVHW